MKASELMIGDWVYVPHNGNATHYGRITAILPSGSVEVDLNGDTVLCSSGSVAPIPLTPEILEKNGFQYNEIPFVQGYEQFGLTLYRGGKGFRINCGANVALVVDSVHQLQQALRLCGIEKEITI